MEKKGLLQTYLKRLIDNCEKIECDSFIDISISNDIDLSIYDIYIDLPIHQNNVHNELNECNSYNPKYRKWSSHYIAKALTKSGDDFKSIDDLDRYISVLIDSSNEYENRFVICEKDNKDGNSIDWTWIISGIGGGKTTMLKMVGLVYAYRYYLQLFECDLNLTKCCEVINRIGRKLNNPDGRCPFFISVHDIKSKNYIKFDEKVIRNIVVDNVCRLLGNDYSRLDAYCLVDSIHNPVYIIDEVEELCDNDVWFSFLDELSNFSCGAKCYLSSDYSFYVDNISTKFFLKNRFKSELCELILDPFIDVEIIQLVKKWYVALGLVNLDNMNRVYEDFLFPLYQNDNYKRIISNLKELEFLIIRSIEEEGLLDNYAVLYSETINKRLMWKKYKNNDEIDVIRQLSYVAYRIIDLNACNSVVNKMDFLECLKCARADLQMYFNSDWPMTHDDINEFIDYLCKMQILFCDADGYRFAHDPYLLYFAANCIISNIFFGDDKRNYRLDYVKSRLEEGNVYWNKVVGFIVMLDYELGCSIISYISSKLYDDEYPKEALNNCLSLLIQLSIIPYVEIDYCTVEKILELMINNEAMWYIFNSMCFEIKEIFMRFGEQAYLFFIEQVLFKYEGLDLEKKMMFTSSVSTALFYCIWNFQIEDKLISNVLTHFYRNNINSGIAEIIDSSNLSEVSHVHFKEIIVEKVRQELKTQASSDFYMLLAMLFLKDNNGDLLKLLSYMQKEQSMESEILGINVLYVSTWINKNQIQTISFYPIKIDLWTWVEFIVPSISANHSLVNLTIILKTFSNLFYSRDLYHSYVSWYSDSSFEKIMLLAFKSFVDNDVFYDELHGYNIYFEHVSFYPSIYWEYCRSIMSRIEFDWELLLTDIHNIRKKSTNPIVKIQSIKLLILLNELLNSEVLDIINDIKEISDKICDDGVYVGGGFWDLPKWLLSYCI